MNYLAHLHLSGSNEDVIVGNFVGDSMRNVALANFKPTVQLGVQLHRAIDAFTDAHELFGASKDLLFAEFRHYSAVLVDMFFDYFLSKNWESYSQVPLTQFADQSMVILAKREDEFPIGAQRFFNYMKRQNVLIKYGTDAGMREVLLHLSSRLSRPVNLADAFDILIDKEDDFDQLFNDFYPQLVSFSQSFLSKHGVVSPML